MVSAKTVNFWAENQKITEAGNARAWNFWDHPQALVLQRRIAFPGEGGAEIPLVNLLRQNIPDVEFHRAVSIGSGSGHKEIELIRSGIVDHITLVEVVPELDSAARSRFADAGLSDRATFVCGDYEAVLANERFDMVHFDNALHHMSGVDRLLQKCTEVLEPGGVFLMDDFVGPTYNQFSDLEYSYANYIRSLLPASPFTTGTVSSVAGRVTIQQFLDSDPSEACDSAAILPSIAKWMPGAQIIPTGGIIYYLACREVFHALEPGSDRDDAIIRLLFELDKTVVKAKPETTCYALALWQKPDGIVGPRWGADWRDLIVWPNWTLPI